jgi:hypothetical protein
MVFPHAKILECWWRAAYISIMPTTIYPQNFTLIKQLKVPDMSTLDFNLYQTNQLARVASFHKSTHVLSLEQLQ